MSIFISTSKYFNILRKSASIGPYNSTNYPNCKANRGVYVISNAFIAQSTNVVTILVFLSQFFIKFLF